MSHFKKSVGIYCRKKGQPGGGIYVNKFTCTCSLKPVKQKEETDELVLRAEGM